MESEPLILLLQSPYGLAMAMLFGALWGSFANVCIHRIPRRQSLLQPPSHCPHCEAPIAWYDNVPVLGYLLLRGRCRRCKARISPRYLFIELLTTALAGVVYARFVEYAHFSGPPMVMVAQFLVYFFFTLVLLVLSAIDLEHQLLPDRITYPAIPTFFLLGQLITGPSSGVTPLQGIFGLVAGYLIVRLIADGYYYLTGREGLGYGDGKLLALIGALFGWRALPFVLLTASLAGLIVGVPIVLWQRRRRQDATPIAQLKLVFGPFLAFGAFMYLLLLVGRDVEGLLLRVLGPLFGETV